MIETKCPYYQNIRVGSTACGNCPDHISETKNTIECRKEKEKLK